MKIAVVFGGGAARGLAHIGVLKVFEKENFPIPLIVGTSVGAVIGGLYALEPNAEKLEDFILQYLSSEVFKKLKIDFFLQQNDQKEKPRRRFLPPISSFLEKGIFFGRSLTRLSFVSPEIIRENSHYLFGDSQFKDSKIPVYFTATNMKSGKEQILEQGLMREAAAASCAIPSILPPIYIDGKPFVDGGCISLVPICASRKLGADFIIACNVSKDKINSVFPLNNGFDVAVRAYEITLFSLRLQQLQDADILISPKVGEVNWADFAKAKECIQKGEEAAKKALKEFWKKKLFKQIKKLFLLGPKQPYT